MPSSSSQPSGGSALQLGTGEAYRPTMEESGFLDFHLAPQDVHHASSSSQTFFADLSQMSEYTFTDLLGLATQQASTSQPVPS